MQSSLDWVARHTAATPRAVAIVVAGQAWSYAELDASASLEADRMAAAGVGRGSLFRFPAALDWATVVRLVAAPRLAAAVWPTTADQKPEILTTEFAFTVVSTSGSTGEPRNVILTVPNVIAALDASRKRLGNDAADRWLLCLPLHHIAGLSVLWRSFSAGGSVLLHEAFDAERAARALRTGEATVASLVPTMLRRILEVDPGPYEGLKAVLVGGGPAPDQLIERALDAGIPALATYGSTETASQLATVAPGEERSSLGTVGAPLEGMEVTFDDGEIMVDGPAVFAGYRGGPPRVGPHRTGDLGFLDGDGRLVVTGRVDDVIVTGGEKVAPQPVEAVLERVPGVARAVVVGAADEDWGQAVVAVVAGSATIEELDAVARSALAPHEVPKRYVVVAELPELENGKVDRLAVAELVART